METRTNTILLVEDCTSFRNLVTSLLNGSPNLRLICEASDGVEAVRKARELKPDLVLMDIGLPKLNGLRAARAICDLVPSAKVVFLTQETSREVLKEALSLGAWGYIAKQDAGKDLLEGLTTVLQGKRFISPALGGAGSLQTADTSSSL